MPVLLISDNPLLGEVLTAALSRLADGVVQAAPDQSVAAIHHLHPSVVVANSSLAPTILAGLLESAQALPSCRVILIDPSCNDVFVLDLCRKSMTRTSDLVRAVAEGITTPPGLTTTPTDYS